MTDDAHKKIDALISEYNEIDVKASELFNGAELLTIYPDIDPNDYYPGDEQPTYKLQSPTEDFDKLHRQIIQQYGRWCTEAEIILNVYLPEKVNEFNFYKNGSSYVFGIVALLKFQSVYSKKPTKREIIQEFNFKFDTQKNILVALANTIHLLLPKKTISQPIPIMEKTAINGTTIIAQRDVNINSQTMNMDVTIQKFEELRSIIQKSAETNELKENLLSQIDELEKSKGTTKYTESIQKFMETAAHSATVWTAIQPMSQFLFGLLQS